VGLQGVERIFLKLVSIKKIIVVCKRQSKTAAVGGAVENRGTLD
jgi:hypothetical protein